MEQKFDIAPFVRLGDELRKGVPETVVAASVAGNEWFTPESVAAAVGALADDMLTAETLSEWLAAYAGDPAPAAKDVAIVMAGNIPAVGFFDLMCVLLCEHRARIKPSSKDRPLTDWLCDLLRRIEPRFSIEPLGQQKPDAVIATGSDTTRHHFEALYADTPALLRGSRHSLAVLTGQESDSDLKGLAEDIFLYFGLGCRNVSRLFLPRGYDTIRLAEVLQRNPITFPKYLNGYRQLRALRLMNDESFTDGEFFLLRESDSEPKGITEITYTYYDTIGETEAWVAGRDAELQCVVTQAFEHPRRADFGRAQHPQPWDYPDGADVIQFLTNLP